MWSPPPPHCAASVIGIDWQLNTQQLLHGADNAGAGDATYCKLQVHFWRMFPQTTTKLHTNNRTYRTCKAVGNAGQWGREHTGLISCCFVFFFLQCWQLNYIREGAGLLRVLQQLTRQLFVIRIDLISLLAQKDSFLLARALKRERVWKRENSEKVRAHAACVCNLRACINFYCCLCLLWLLLVLPLFLFILFWGVARASWLFSVFTTTALCVTHVGYKFAFSSVKHAIKTRQY